MKEYSKLKDFSKIKDVDKLLKEVIIYLKEDEEVIEYLSALNNYHSLYAHVLIEDCEMKLRLQYNNGYKDPLYVGKVCFDYRLELHFNVYGLK